MAVDIEDLIIAPFREVVKRGNEAFANAQADANEDAAPAMEKAAKALVREGDRALKRLQPLWDSQVEKHGDIFKDSMSKNTDVEEKRRKLDDMLYDFEDFLEVDTFSEEKFQELQSLTKALALEVLETIKRLRIDGVPVSPPAKQPLFPPLPPLPPHALASLKPPIRPLGPSVTTPTTNGPPKKLASTRDAVPLPIRRLSRSTASRDMRDGATTSARSHSAIDVREGEPASPTTTEHSSLDIPTFPMPTRTSAWVEHHSKLTTANKGETHKLPLALDQITTTARAAPRAHDQELGSPLHPKPRTLSVRTATTTSTHQDKSTPASTPATTPASMSTYSSLHQRRSSISTAPSPASIIGYHQEPALSADEMFTSPTHLADLPDLSLPPVAEFDEGLMLAEGWTPATSDGTSVLPTRKTLSELASQLPDCSIGPRSSLYQMKGFCNGAHAFTKGSAWDGVKKTTGYVAGNTTSIGRCTHCEYAHQFEELSMDLSKDPKANFHSDGLKFRIRFLYKSHLTASKMTEAYYGCLFCAQAGSTVREGDATVFKTSDMLLLHLACHPQPLPDVPGVTVLYGSEIPASDIRLNDFDLHFIAPAKMGGIPISSADEISQMPAATATKTHVQRWGEKKLPRPDGLDDKTLLEFFVGARIMGIELHARWGGKWAAGWHNGQWGMFPSKMVEWEAPRPHEMPPMLPSADGTTRSVVARWKFEPKDAGAGGWLGFDKGETISNLSWLDQKHWCWGGTNSKGKVGFFPRAYVLADEIQEETGRPGSVKSKKMGGRSRLFGRSKTSN